MHNIRDLRFGDIGIVEEDTEGPREKEIIDRVFYKTLEVIAQSVRWWTRGDVTYL